ncbi:MAG TPA: alpha/beta hydrolase [Phycisphaerae bacterium]|nr:alpha/beta hydrolase [Phycisphaerae bacterium]HRY70605.1 alpha/beta hydrolase [Phycisphaerae bacterium]HSA28345.1 alpha/beta hydrolase [Phycisphaerae bacterium]
MTDSVSRASKGGCAAQTCEARRSWGRCFRAGWRFAGYLVAAYVAWCAVLYFMQDGIVFPRELAGSGDSTPPAGTVVMTEQIEGGGQVLAWFVAAPGLTPARPGPLVVFFHGNAELIDGQGDLVRAYGRLGCSVLLPEYRGYGQCGGSPSEVGIVQDAVRFLDRAAKLPGVDPSRIVLHGRSLGGGVSAQVAVHRPPTALVLQSTFTSTIPLAHGYGVPGFLSKHSFRTDRVVADLKAPLLIFHGVRDSIIPVAHGRKLRDVAPGSTYVEYDCDHNDFPGSADEDYWRTIEAFLVSAGVLGDRRGPGAAQPEPTTVPGG